MSDSIKFWTKHLAVYVGVAFLTAIIPIALFKGNISNDLIIGVLSLLVLGYSIAEGVWGAKGRIEGIRDSWQPPVRLILFMAEIFILILLGNHAMMNISHNAGLWGKTDGLVSLFMRMTVYYGVSWYLAKRFRNMVLFFLGIILFESLIIGISYLSFKENSVSLCLSSVTLSAFAGVLLAFFSSLRVKILIWKEVKEIWWVLVIALAIPLVMGAVAGFEKAYFLTAIAVYFLFTGFLGGRSFASESENHTMDYITTRPLHPRTLFLVKYFTGIGLIILLLLLSISFISGSPNFSLGEELVIIWAASVPLILFYSFCLIFSILTKDSLRSSLLGFGGAVVFGSLIALFVRNYPNTILPYIVKDQYIPLLGFLKGFFYYVIFISLITSVTGLIYYCSLKKRLEWKNGFAVMIPASLILLTAFHAYYYGDLRADYIKEDKPLITSENSSLFPWEQKLYYYQGIGNRNDSIIIGCLDLSNPVNPEVHVMKTAYDFYYNPFTVLFDKNNLYAISTNDFYNRNELIKYKLGQDGKIKEIGRIKAPSLPATEFSDWTTSTFVLLFDDPDNLYLTLRQKDKHLYYDKKGHLLRDPYSVPDRIEQLAFKRYCAVVDKRTFRTKEFFQIDSTMNLTPYFYGMKYKQYAFYYDYYSSTRKDKSLCLYDVSDWKHPRLVVKDILHFSMNDVNIYNRNYMDSMMKIQGNYLCFSMDKNALRVYDLSQLPKIREVSHVPYGFIDRMAESQAAGLSFRRLLLEGPNAFVINYRGVLWIDITDPAHPVIKKRDNSYDPSSYALYYKNRLYTWDMNRACTHIYDFGRGSQ
jgi:hypothetical protein